MILFRPIITNIQLPLIIDILNRIRKKLRNNWINL
jgi:hypothetical protein